MLQPKNEALARLQRLATDPTAILKQAGERYLWDRYQEDKKAEEPQKAASQ